MSSEQITFARSREAMILDALEDPVIATRLDGTILAFSLGAERLYGWPRAEALGQKVHEMLHTTSTASSQEIRNALLGPEAHWTGELRKTRRDGSRLTVSSRQRCLTEPDGSRIIVACDRDRSERSRVEDTVRAQQEDQRFLELRERFQFSAEAAQIGYWFCDLPFDKLIWDERVKEHFWLPADADVDIALFYKCIHPDDRDRTRNSLEESIRTGSRYDIEYRTVSPDGRERWVRAIGRTAYDAVGTPTRFDGITQDFTSLKRAEAELRDSQNQLTAFADTIPALAWMAGGDGGIFWFNRRWYDYTGTTPEQMQGWGWQAVHDPAELPCVMARWTESLRTGEPFEMIFPLKGADGVFRSFLTRVTPMRNEQGEVVRWFGTNTEIDELQRTRRQLQLHEERVRVALQNVPIVLYTTDRELRYTWMYRHHPSYPAESILGHRDIDVEPEKFREIHELKQSVLHSGIPACREIIYRFEGRTEIFEYTVEPLRDPSGEVYGLTVAALDITQMRLAEETLRKTEKLAVVGRLAASIAHEINNPLEAVVSLLYVARNMTVDDEVRGYLSTAEEELARVAHIVTQSLRFHRQSTAAAEVRISTLIDSALALYRGRLQDSPVQLITEYRDTRPALCFPSELRQVFANLIGNAFEATRAGKIVLRAGPATDWRRGESGIRAVIADTGSGIDPKTLEHLFEPFITTKGEFGTGLGLWVCAGILRRHNASIKVRTSAAPGRSGTVFIIFFPDSAPAPLPPETPIASLPQQLV